MALKSPKKFSVEDKLSLLNLADKLKNVTAACEAMGMSRISYYRMKKAYEEGGIEDLKNTGKISQDSRMITSDVDDAVIRVSLEYPFEHRLSQRSSIQHR